jgi:hypothetical protein
LANVAESARQVGGFYREVPIHGLFRITLLFPSLVSFLQVPHHTYPLLPLLHTPRVLGSGAFPQIISFVYGQREES